MTGTAATEVSEFDSIYKLPVAVVPTNRSIERTDNPDVVFRCARTCVSPRLPACAVRAAGVPKAGAGQIRSLRANLSTAPHGVPRVMLAHMALRWFVDVCSCRPGPVAGARGSSHCVPTPSTPAPARTPARTPPSPLLPLLLPAWAGWRRTSGARW